MTRSADELPLARFEQVRSRDVDEAREAVGHAFCPHELTPLDGARSLDARFHSIRLGDIGLHYLNYGAPVRIAPGELESFFLVQIPLAGQAEITCGQARIMSNTRLASVPAPTEKLTMRWGPDNPQLILWLDRSRVEQHLGTMLDAPIGAPLRFELGMRMQDPAIQSWYNVVELLRREIDRAGPVTEEPLAMYELERLLLSRLLLAQPHNYTSQLHRNRPHTTPKVIRRAADLIEGHAHEPLTVEDIAEAVGLGVRALQQGFRRHLDATPISYLREVRLQRVKSELSAADPTRATVTRIASQWGFVHAGRFSTQYRERFGESPSTTLRS